MSGKQERAHWGSKFGFVLAAAGSAIGLGNIWRFPYVTQENGGGVFVAIYLLAVLLIGLPVMLAELAIGRRTQRNPVGAFKILNPNWKFVGLLGVATGIGILSYYSVVAGWTVGYAVKSISGDLDPKGFGPFISNAPLQLGYMVVFILLTCAVVVRGVQDGIERMARVLMPVLFVLMLGLIIRGLTLPTAAEGLRFYLMPDFDHVSAKTFLYGIGQAFFSLSLGMGVMITYGAYIDKKDNLATSALAVVGFDTLIAIMAGFLIFPVIGSSLTKGGPTLVFVTMIEQFNAMAGGRWVSVFFFLMLSVAALTSTVSLLEVVTAYFIDEWKMGRAKAVALVGFVALILGVPSALSLGAVDGLSSIVGGKGFLDLMDFVFGNLSLSFGALMMCVFLVYRWGVKDAAGEILSSAPGFRPYVGLWRVLMGGVVPAAILVMIVYMLVTGGGV